MPKALAPRFFEHADIFAKAPRTIYLGHISSVFVLIYLALQNEAVPRWFIYVWGFSELIATPVALEAWRRLYTEKRDGLLTIAPWLRALKYLFLYVGASWGTMLFVSLNPLNPVHLAVQVAIAAGASAAATKSLAVIPQALAFYVVPFLGLLATRLLFETSEYALLAVLVLVFMVMLLALGKDIFTSVADYIDIRSQNLELALRYKKAAKLAEDAVKEKTNFISAASHDLRQPIHALSIFNQTFRDNVKKNSALQTIANKQHLLIGSLSDMLETMLEASRLEAKALTITVAPVSLDDAFSKLGHTLQTLAKENSVKLSIVPSSLTILADKKQLMRVLANLTVNAIKASLGGHVVVGARPRGLKVVISVLDNGRGIDPSDQTRIFDRFVQLSPRPSTGPAGLGLGLSIVADLCELMEMPISLHSQPNKGSHFQVTATKAEPQAYSASLPVNEARRAATNRRLVLLVVDDDKEALDAMVQIFRQWGHAARGVTCYNAAIDTLDDLGQPDLLVTDYQLDGTATGLDLYNEISRQYRDLLAVIVTGTTGPADLRILAKSELPVFFKPFDPNNMREFLATLQRLPEPDIECSA